MPHCLLHVEVECIDTWAKPARGRRPRSFNFKLPPLSTDSTESLGDWLRTIVAPAFPEIGDRIVEEVTAHASYLLGAASDLCNADESAAELTTKLSDMISKAKTARKERAQFKADKRPSGNGHIRRAGRP